MNTRNFANKTLALLVACGAVVGVANSAMAQQTPAVGEITFTGVVGSNCSFSATALNDYTGTVSYTPTVDVSGNTTLLAATDTKSITCNTADPDVTLTLDSLVDTATGVAGTDYDHKVDFAFDNANLDLSIQNTVNATADILTTSTTTIAAGTATDAVLTSQIVPISPATFLQAGSYTAVLTYTVTPN